MINYSDFEKIDIRVGTILKADEFPQARKPAYKLLIDFGLDLGTKKSSAQITRHYTTDQLIGKQVLAVINFEPKQIGPFVSEVLTLGLADENGDIILCGPQSLVPNGKKLF